MRIANAVGAPPGNVAGIHGDPTNSVVRLVFREMQIPKEQRVKKTFLKEERVERYEIQCEV